MDYYNSNNNSNIEENIYSELDKEIDILVNETGTIFYKKSNKKIKFKDIFKNKTELRYIISIGVSYSFYRALKKFAPFNEEEWAEFLDISSKSIQRLKNDDKKFKPIYTEKIMEIAEIVSIGRELFGNFKKFKIWLETPNFAFGNIKPKELLTDSYGIEMLKTELVNSEQGIFI
ncbi:MAG TPA: DUF2384 domain-containing protein [Ignavibacteria bacterium]|nr:DUF2384 domain-containing protein [Ignavibacteria bacterium]